MSLATASIVRATLAWAALTAGGVLLSCSSGGGDGRSQSTARVRPAPTLAPPPYGADKPATYPGLHNVVAYHDGFFSGGAPEGDEGMRSLEAMGVRTIISVDGSEPDVCAARARGMRYVHLPIGYNGFDEKRELELARAVRDLSPEGPVYMHCHHGKHRSAGAAGTVAVCLGWMDNAEATRLMKVSGTAPDYTGLYRCTADARPLTAAQINMAPESFPEVSHPSGFVQGMVEVDEANDHLRLIEKAQWKAPENHPDLVPVAEAATLADLFRDVAAGPYATTKPTGFASMLREAGERAQTLEDMLARGETDTRKLSTQFALVAASCKDCHAKHRD